MHIWLLMSVFTTGRCWNLDGSPNVCVTTIVQKSSRVANWPRLRFNFFQPVHPCHCPRNVNYIRLIFQRRRNRPELYNGQRRRIIVLLLFQFFFSPHSITSRILSRYCPYTRSNNVTVGETLPGVNRRTISISTRGKGGQSWNFVLWYSWCRYFECSLKLYVLI